MANERPLLRYRNPDSTQDINDRLAGLLVKGCFEGGTVTVVNGLEISLSAFSTIGSDGMFVKQGNSTTFVVSSAPDIEIKSYVVIQQQYQVNAEPTVSVEVLTSDVFAVTGPLGEQGADNPNMIVFGTVTVAAGETMLSSNNVSYLERDAIDVLERSHFRGLVATESELPIPGVSSDPTVPADENQTGDYYIVSDGSGGMSVPTFFSWNGSAWVNSTDTTDIQQQLDDHRGNSNESGTELHVSTAQAAALAGAGIDDPSVSNRYLLEDFPILPTADQKAALAGNGPDLEDELPNATNPYITSTKVIASPDEIAGVLSFSDNPGDGTADWVELGLSENSDGYYVGLGPSGSAQAWFALYSPVEATPHQYINEEFESIVIVEVRTGDPGNQPGSFELNPSGDGHVDNLGFFIPDGGTGGTLYLKISNAISVNTARASFGRRSHFGDLGPDLILNRGPQAAQINSVMLRLLTGTPNAQFNDAIWDNINPGQVAAWSAPGVQFVAADPLSMLNPVGVRGTANNLIQEGMLVLPGAGFPTGSKVYADKANPGSLTITENEWFIGTAITDTILLVNMNGIPLQASGEVTPGVTFPSGLFTSVQEGQTVSFELATGSFVRASTTDPLKLPTGLRGTNNNVIMSGLYVPSTGDPFMTGIKYYADPNTPGFLTSSPNDWYVGVATDTDQLLVNLNSVAVPRQWTVEHDSGTGRHAFYNGGVGSRPIDPVDGTIFLRTDVTPPKIEYWNGATWEDATSPFNTDFAIGTRMVFVQDTIPAGWTLDNAIQDAVIRIMNDESLANVLSGSWTISGVSDDPLALGEDQIPVHYHNMLGASGDSEIETLNDRGPIGSDDGGGSGGTNPFASEMSGVRENYGSNHTTPSDNDPHQHGITSDGTWRPYNVTAIVCTKAV